jgi:hypothetical protein
MAGDVYVQSFLTSAIEVPRAHTRIRACC